MICSFILDRTTQPDKKKSIFSKEKFGFVFEDSYIHEKL